jgi:hypothetical protein
VVLTILQLRQAIEILDQVKRTKQSQEVQESNLITIGFRAKNHRVLSKVQESEMV